MCKKFRWGWSLKKRGGTIRIWSHVKFFEGGWAPSFSSLSHKPKFPEPNPPIFHEHCFAILDLPWKIQVVFVHSMFRRSILFLFGNKIMITHSMLIYYFSSWSPDIYMKQFHCYIEDTNCENGIRSYCMTCQVSRLQCKVCLKYRNWHRVFPCELHRL